MAINWDNPWDAAIGIGTLGFIDDFSGDQAAANATNTTNQATAAAVQGNQDAIDYLGDISDQQQGLMQPYYDAGVNATDAYMDYMGFDFHGNVGAGGLNPNAPQFGDYVDPFNFDPNNVTLDPGYLFRQQEGMTGLQNQLGAAGMSQSGAALQAALRYNQGFASNEYSNAYNRQYGAATDVYNRDVGQFNQAYGAYSDEGNRLANMAGMGVNTAMNMSNTLGTMATGTAGAMQNIGNIQAGGFNDLTQINAANDAAMFNNAMSVGNLAISAYTGGAMGGGGNLSWWDSGNGGNGSNYGTTGINTDDYINSPNW